MLTVADVISALQDRQGEPSEEELRRLPDRKALIHGRLSGFRQVKESKESVRQIAAQVGKAIEDGYKTKLDPAAVERQLEAIQAGEASPGVMEDGEVIVNCLGLGVSGSLPEDKRPDLKVDMDLLRKNELGAIYVTEGANRLSRDPDRVVSATLLKMMKDTNCKLRTPDEILSPRVDRDWQIIHGELERGAEELTVMNKRLFRRKAIKAGRGEFVGEPVPPGFVLNVAETRSSGQRVYGRLQPYPPHAEIDIKVLTEYVRQRGSVYGAHKVLRGTTYPFFPPEFEYMAHLSSLRQATRTENGYLLSPVMIRSLAMNPKLIGLWHWSGVVRADNHEAIVPVDLFLEAYELAARRGKPRGKGIKFDPLEWSGLLYCCNHDPPIRISGNAASNSYRCQTEYFRGRGSTCLDISARYIDEPLTTTILGQLHFSPLADEVLAQLEKEATRVDLEAEQTKREIAHLEDKLENLKSYLGCGDKEREDIYWEQYTKVKNRLEELRSRPVSQQVSNKADYHLVRSFLAGLPDKFATYPRGTRNRLLRILIDRVEIRHPEHDIEARIHWKTDQVQVLHIKRARAKGNREMRWSKEELSLLQMLWPNASQEAILAALPGRTCKGIAHQANIRGWKRSSSVARPISRRRWTVDETEKTRELYELGIPLQDIMSRMERSRTAILQRASEEKWHRPLSNQKPTSHLFWYEESPILVNGISSGRGYRG